MSPAFFIWRSSFIFLSIQHLSTIYIQSCTRKNHFMYKFDKLKYQDDLIFCVFRHIAGFYDN